jgi:hypothetical protein
MEEFWLIAVTEGNEDEAEFCESEGAGREGCPGHPAPDAQAVVG